MKYLITAFLLLFAVSARAQITLEHTYTNNADFGLVQVDSATWKYVNYNEADSITLYNLDHSFDRVIVVPDTPVEEWHIAVIARHLFEPDSEYCYMLEDAGGIGGKLRVFSDDGSDIFTCDSCEFGTGSAVDNDLVHEGLIPPVIINTSGGSKMLVTRSLASATQRVEIYSLPGKLPTCSTTATSGVIPSIAYTNPTLPISAYPNPSSSSVRIAYELPNGVSSGDLILTTEDGREVKRYRVTSAFSDLLIEAGDLPSGSYFYHLETEKGESQAQRISLVK